MKKLLTILLALALSLPLAACGPSGHSGAVVRYGLSNAWDSLMPYNSPSGSNYSRIVCDKLYDRLAYVHADGTLDPRGAASWESADGGYAVLFHLDQGAAFHDGEPVTAEHWADTIALLTAPDCPTLGRAAFSVLAGTDGNGAAPGAPLAPSLSPYQVLARGYAMVAGPDGRVRQAGQLRAGENIQLIAAHRRARCLVTAVEETDESTQDI